MIRPQDLIDPHSALVVAALMRRCITCGAPKGVSCHDLTPQHAPLVYALVHMMRVPERFV